MSRLAEVLRNILRVATKRHLSLWRRFLLLGVYIHIVLKRFVRRSGLAITKYSQHRFLGYTVHMDNFEDFYWTFLEAFILEEYRFIPQNSSPVIIDCGGNIGISILYFKWRWPESVITVFEPEQRNVELIRNNIIENKLKNVTLVQKAVGAEDGSIYLSGSNRAATIHPERTGVNSSENQQRVELTRLSPYIPDGGIDFLKMDIEGAEDDVIGELAEVGTLSRIQALTFEYHQKETDGQERFQKLRQTLEQAGLRVLPLAETLHPQRNTHVIVASVRT